MMLVDSWVFRVCCIGALFCLTTVVSHFPSVRLTYKGSWYNEQRVGYVYRVCVSRKKIFPVMMNYNTLLTATH